MDTIDTKITKLTIDKPFYKNIYLISYMLLQGNIDNVKKILKIDKNNYKKISSNVLINLCKSFHYDILLDFFSLLNDDAIKYLSLVHDDWYVLYFFKNAHLSHINKLLKWKHCISFDEAVDDWYILRVYLSEYYSSNTVNIKLLNELLILSKDFIEKKRFSLSIINLSCVNGYDENVLDTILKHFPNAMSDYDSNLNTPLILACQTKNEKLVNYIFKKQEIDYNYFGTTCAILCAIKNNNNSMLRQLLQFKDIDVNIHDTYKWSPGHLIFAKNISIDLDLKQKIIKLTKNLNSQNLNGNTILHHICSLNVLKDYKDILKDKKLNLFVRNILDMTPIHYCSDIPMLKSITNVSAKDIDSVLANTCKYPIDNKINFITNTQINYSLFTATDYDSMIYLLYFIRKYKIKILAKDEKYKILRKNNNQEISKIFDIYCAAHKNNNYLQNINIMWHDKNNYCYSKGIETMIKDNSGIKFIYVTIINDDSDHANCLIIDGNLKRIIHFEPLGIINLNILQDFDKKFKKIFAKLLPNYKYYSPKDYMDTNSFQHLSNERNKNLIKIGDIGGFCLAWTLWFLELYIKNPSANLSTLIDNSIKKIINTKSLFSEYIRSYASKLTSFRETILEKNENSGSRLYIVHRSNREIHEIFNLINQLYKLS